MVPGWSLREIQNVPVFSLDCQKMLIGLDRKRFEAALIDWAGSGGAMVRMPALRMGDGDPSQHL
jgi:hypothetical protein